MRERVEHWTEKKIQDALYCHCAIKRHELITPNSKVFGWESDLVSVTKAGLMFEFEIKISRSDFRADAKKDKSRYMENPVRKLYWGGEKTVDRPNYFYYVTPPNLITVGELPAFAGLIYAEFCPTDHALYYGTVSMVKDAPKLHSEKINEWQKRQLNRAVTMRYWRQRLDLNGTDKVVISEPTQLNNEATI